MEPEVRIMVNGETRDVPRGTTVAGLIHMMGLGKSACAAEVNRRLVPRREHESVALHADDRVELVTLVGGG